MLGALVGAKLTVSLSPQPLFILFGLVLLVCWEATPFAASRMATSRSSRSILKMVGIGRKLYRSSQFRGRSLQGDARFFWWNLDVCRRTFCGTVGSRRRGCEGPYSRHDHEVASESFNHDQQFDHWCHGIVRRQRLFVSRVDRARHRRPRHSWSCGGRVRWNACFRQDEKRKCPSVFSRRSLISRGRNDLARDQRMKNKLETPHRRFDMESVVGFILLAGVIGSVCLILCGYIWRFMRIGEMRMEYQIAATNLFQFLKTDIRELFHGSLRPRLLVNSGIALLMATPYARVLVSIFYFAFFQRNWKYTLFTTVVFSILTYSLFAN